MAEPGLLPLHRRAKWVEIRAGRPNVLPLSPLVSCLLEAVRPAGGRGWVGNWSPGIGDPSVVGWVTVVLYFFAALICLRVGWGKGRPLGRSELIFFRVVTFALVAL